MVPGLNGELKRTALVKKIKKDTKLTLVGRKPFENFGIVNPPIYRTSTVLFKNTKELINKIFYLIENKNFSNNISSNSYKIIRKQYNLNNVLSKYNDII